MIYFLWHTHKYHTSSSDLYTKLSLGLEPLDVHVKNTQIVDYNKEDNVNSQMKIYYNNISWRDRAFQILAREKYNNNGMFKGELLLNPAHFIKSSGEKYERKN